MISHQQNDGDDCFEEDGCTFDFQDETESSSGGPVFRVYDGEDFGQYLDDDAHPSPPSPWEIGQGVHVDPGGGGGGGGGGGAETVDRRPKSTALLREKIGRLLVTGAGGSVGGKSKRASAAAAPQVPSYSIHEVSFADCKMGSVVAGGPPRGAAAGQSASGSDSGIDCRSGYSLETESDLGPQRSATWWDVDTLSSRRQGLPSSVSALELRQRSSPRSVDSTSGISRPPVGGGRRDDVMTSPVDDVVIRRQQQQQQTSSDVTAARASSGGVKRLSNPLRKIYDTISRRKSTNLQEMSQNMDYEDIRL